MVEVVIFSLFLGPALIIIGLFLSFKNAPITWSWARTTEWFKSSSSAKVGLACMVIGSAILLGLIAIAMP